jgi:hypothetical protein
VHSSHGIFSDVDGMAVTVYTATEKQFAMMIWESGYLIRIGTTSG